ncbi:hypothetical protein BCR44DRAFT_1323283 [Catenaria anguillulae PL171]|uniref:XPG N-terminal domain-containing protein n=1 Tax=Catenaria anguillulae PL171 TaxID=765915 RepID=A0A1Y2HUT4_9FUNG|nr:hypothetical protein BCR44DRAFT_1323283 [Catenaria anguillulae PL171]
MGITNLLPLIKKAAPHLLRNLPHPTTLAGTRLAIDGHMLLHRFWYAPRPGTSPLGPNGQPNHHVQYFYNFLELCDHLQVRPTIVFDYGVRPLAKQRVVHRKRAAARSRQTELHHTAQTTVDGLERHLDLLNIADARGEVVGPIGYQHLPIEALETEESRVVERTMGSGTEVHDAETVAHEFRHLPEEPLETEETRMLEQAFALKEHSSSLGSKAEPVQQQVSTSAPQNKSALDTISRFRHLVMQKISDQLKAFRPRSSESARMESIRNKTFWWSNHYLPRNSHAIKLDSMCRRPNFPHWRHHPNLYRALRLPSHSTISIRCSSFSGPDSIHKPTARPPTPQPARPTAQSQHQLPISSDRPIP